MKNNTNKSSKNKHNIAFLTCPELVFGSVPVYKGSKST